MNSVHCGGLPFVCAALFGLLFTNSAWAGPPEAPVAINFHLTDLSGQVHALSQNDLRKVRVFVFLSTDCPISNSYLTTLNALAKNAPRGVELFGVIADSTVVRVDAARHFQEYGAQFPVLFDASEWLAGVLTPTHVPEAFVLTADNRVAYRGAIDDVYQAIGRRRPAAERHYLQDAMASAAAGELCEPAFTQAVGCLRPTGVAAVENPKVTYCRDVAPILSSRCVTCHREGQVAPFSLTQFSDAVRHIDMMIQVTQDRSMPPWIPGPQSQHAFVGDRRLSDRELEVLSQWRAAGCPEGDQGDLPPAQQFAEGWQLGTPDLVVKMAEPFTVRASGPDILQNFVIPLSIPSDKLVAAVEFHPGNKRVVHHAVLFLDDKGQARKLDRATPEPGYANFGGPGFLPSGALGGWSVGNTARRLPNEMGRHLKKGSDLVVQVHYHPTGKEEVDQSELGLYFVNKPVEESLAEASKLVGSMWLANYQIDIAAGVSDYQQSATYTLPKGVTLVGVVPHMHLLGKSMRAVATLPDGSQQVLVDVPNWNYNWQDEYYFEQPFALPAGTTLQVTAVFDNSSGNPSNPSAVPKRVTWGDGTNDEMLFCFFLMTAEKPADLVHVILDNLRHDMQQPRLAGK